MLGGKEAVALMLTAEVEEMLRLIYPPVGQKCSNVDPETTIELKRKNQHHSRRFETDKESTSFQISKIEIEARWRAK